MQSLNTKLERAREDVDSAATDLERLLNELSSASRADKTTVSRVVEDALRKLRAAKSALAGLQSIVIAADG